MEKYLTSETFKSNCHVESLYYNGLTNKYYGILKTKLTEDIDKQESLVYLAKLYPGVSFEAVELGIRIEGSCTLLTKYGFIKLLNRTTNL